MKCNMWLDSVDASGEPGPTVRTISCKQTESKQNTRSEDTYLWQAQVQLVVALLVATLECMQAEGGLGGVRSAPVSRAPAVEVAAGMGDTSDSSQLSHCRRGGM